MVTRSRDDFEQAEKVLETAGVKIMEEEEL